jgi:DNA polymerase III subunit alpha
MATERDSFGFYYSAHPVDSHRHLLAAQKVKSFAELSSLTPSGEDGRTTATMAALIEDTRWRTSARGRRYLVVTLSDPSGQFQATAFDDEPIAALQKAAESGECGLLTVEVDRRPGDEMPRVAVKRFQPLDALARRTRLQMIGKDRRPLAHSTDRSRACAQPRRNRCRAPARAARRRGRRRLLAGRDFALDAEVAARVERLVGEDAVDLAVQEPPKLALVG